LESIAFARSQRGSGTMIGKRLRMPVTLRIEVSDDTAAISTSSHGGSNPPIERNAIRAIATIATT
jgi:hypothetical protein